MQSQAMNNEKLADKKLFIKMVLDAWQTQQTRFNKLLDTFTEEQLLMETAPGRNRGIYLAGHLIAVNDAMLPILGFGEKLFPGLANIFLINPDKSGIEMPSLTELKKCSNEINATLSSGIDNLEPGGWFERHTAISDDDFAKEPHRNKLNILVNRTNHHSYHLGQLAFLVRDHLR